MDGDEIFQFNEIRGPFKVFWLHHYYGDNTRFPGDYLLTYPFVRFFGLNKWGLAIPHIIVTILGLFLLYKLCRRFYVTLGAYLTVFALVCLNKNLSYHSFEFRPYAVLPVLAIGSLYFWDRIITQYIELKYPARWGLGFFFIFVAGYHAYGILILSLPLIFLLLRKGLEGCGTLLTKSLWLYLGLIGFLGLAVWAWYASSNLFGISGMEGFTYMKNTFQYIPDPAYRPMGFLKGIIGNLIGFRPLYFLLVGPVIALLIPNRQKFIQVIFLLILVILPLGLILLVDVRSHYWLLQRQFVWVMPFFAVYLGWTFDVILLAMKHFRLKSL